MLQWIFMKKLTNNKLINLALFQGVWLVTVLGAANNNLWPGLMGFTVFLAVHYCLSSSAYADFLLAVCAVFIGLAAETIFVQTDLLVYSAKAIYVGIVPLWVLILWGNFALIMNGCLNWLQGRYVLAAVLGFMGAPLSYLGGIQLGAAVAGTDLEIVLLGVAFTYAVVTPCFLYMALRLAGSRSE
jgi:hypothetical protein